MESIKYSIKKLDKGELIFGEGEPGNVAYLIKKGSIIIYRMADGKRVDLDTLQAGDIFGEMGVISGQTRSASAEAKEETHLLVIDEKLLSQLLAKSPQTIQILIKMLINRLRKTDYRVSAMKTADNFMSICHIIDLSFKLHEAKNPVSADGTPTVPGLDYLELVRSVKQIVDIPLFAIEEILEQLDSMNMIQFLGQKGEFVRLSDAGNKYVRVVNPAYFITQAVNARKSLGLTDAFNSPGGREFVDLYAFALAFNKRVADIYNLIANKVIPDSLFYIHKASGIKWMREIGEELLDKTRIGMYSKDYIGSLSDLTFVSDDVMRRVLSKTSIHDIAAVISLADSQVREKIYSNMAENTMGMIRSMLATNKDITVNSSAKVSAFLNAVRKEKG